ncbi:MAG TPA: helix-turn-helix domain-containing protein [Rubrobacteraceae bacterium]|nr:helix-turn-helix domain-containing protein [Rubrobacteraceae bacterium]
MERAKREFDGWHLDFGGREAEPGVERSDAARNRRRILATARRLFEERGVTRVSMEEIARESGVGKGTLYRRFPHKGLLCQALLDEPTRKFQEETLRMIGVRGPGALEKLAAFLESVVYFTEENLDLLYGGHETLSGAERIAHLSHPARGWPRSTVLGLLRMADREGVLEDDLDLEYLATALVAPLEIDLYYYQRRVQGYSPERISAGIRSIVPRPTR